MSHTITCASAQEQLTHIKLLEQKLNELILEIQKPNITRGEKTEAIANARRIKKILEREVTALEEQVNPFERLFDLKEQYKSQIKMLETAQILKVKEINGEKIKGITDIEGEFQPVPTLKEVISRLREKKELLTRKQTQGFGKIRLVPFGMSLDSLIEKYRDVLIDHFNTKKLFFASYDRNDLGEERVLLRLDLSCPLQITHEYNDADITGNLVYGVKKFDPVNHGGKTKSEILKERRTQNKSGWDILVLENNVNIPMDGHGEEIGERKQLETEKSPEQYLELFQTEFQYKGEVGLTPEDALIHFIAELDEYDEVIDDHDGNGSIGYNIGGYFIQGVRGEAGLVPYSCFSRKYQATQFKSIASTHCHYQYGLRSGVKV